MNHFFGARPPAGGVTDGAGSGAAPAAAGEDPWRTLLDVLDLRALGVDEDGQDVFEGDNQPQPHGRVFGGQVLGQSLVAATRTIPAERLVHSMHAYFLRAGDMKEPVTFTVDRLRDGRSFSARRVQAVQHGRPILSMIASFQTGSDGVEHQDEMPQVPDPESLPSTQEVLAEVDHPMVHVWMQARPIDIRHIEQPIYWKGDPQRRPTQAVWMRAAGPVPTDDEAVHRSILGYASDYTLLEPVLRRHGQHWLTNANLRMASLDHAMWWHRPVRVDEWFLYVQTTPSASGSRGLATGRIFSRDGTLVATTAQEGMVRISPPAEGPSA